MIFFIPFSLSGQLRIELEIGAQHDGIDRVQLCFGITNTLPNDIDFSPNDNQKIVIQFGVPPSGGDFTVVNSCLDPQDFKFLIESLTSTIDLNAISTMRSDSQDFEMAFKFNQRVSIQPDKTLEIGCIDNFEIHCSCDNLIALVDCSGIQHTEFFNGNIIIAGAESCPEIEFPIPEKFEEEIEIFCQKSDDNGITVEWEELEDVNYYEVRINDEVWQKVDRSTLYTIEEIASTETQNVEVRAITGCEPMPYGMISCTFESEKEKLVYIPNAFSPNGDGINDELVISSQPGISIKELRIYERFGGLIYRATPADHQEVITWNVQGYNKKFGAQLFLCQVILIQKNREEEIVYGDVTMFK